MPLSVCKPNAWYLVVRCKSCGTRQPIFRDPSQGKAELLRDYKHTCVECGHVDVYSVEDIERYHHKAA
jgi:ribosomal protein S27E